MHPDMEQYLKNPRGGKIAFIKLLRSITGRDLAQCKAWADKAWSIDLDALNKEISELKPTEELSTIEGDLIRLLEKYDLYSSKVGYCQLGQHYDLSLSGAYNISVIFPRLNGHFHCLAKVYKV